MVAKRGLHKTYKRVANCSIKELTQPQKDVLYYLIDEFLTTSQIANIRGTSRQAVDKIKQKLIELGVIREVATSSYIKGGYYPVTSIGSNKTYRLHAQNLVINIIDVSQFYLNLLKTENRSKLDNNTIMLYNDKLIIYSNKDFWGDSVNQCVRLSLDYWQRFMYKLENRYKIFLIKGERQKIKEFRGEIAKVGDELAKKINLSDNTLRIYIKGELRLICDKSFKFDELEAVHKDYYIQDMSYIEKYYEDLLNNKDYLMLPSDIQKTIQKTIVQQEKDREFKNEVLLMVTALSREIEKLKNK